MNQAANDSYMDIHIPSVVGTKFRMTWKGGGGREGKRLSAVYITYHRMFLDKEEKLGFKKCLQRRKKYILHYSNLHEIEKVQYYI